MQSVSPSYYLRVARRTREGLPGGVVWTSLLVFLLTLAFAKSTVTAQWVPNIEIVPEVALAGATVTRSSTDADARPASPSAIGL